MQAGRCMDGQAPTDRANSLFIPNTPPHHSDGGGSSGVSPALTELLRAHAMRRWGEDLAADARQRLEQGGLPPLDLFLANPSAVARKLASLQVYFYVCMRNRAIWFVRDHPSHPLSFLPLCVCENRRRALTTSTGRTAGRRSRWRPAWR